MALYQPPKQFVQDLQAYDPLLRIRWSDSEDCWRIERKVRPAREVDPSPFANHEDWITTKDGCVCVLKCKMNQLDQRVVYTLWKGDIQRQGGAQALADAIERGEQDTLMRSRAETLDRIEVHAKERFDYMNRVRTLPEHLPHSGKDMSITAGV